MTDFQFFAAIADAAIACTEQITANVLALRGIDRHHWPKRWPTLEDNPHGTLTDTHVRIALAAMDDTDGQHEMFVRGWLEWLAICKEPLETPDGVRERVYRLSPSSPSPLSHPPEGYPA